MKNEIVIAPEYVSSEPKEREEFLSQHGNFTPGEREIFHFLCAQWQPEIPYGRIVAGANLGLGNKRGEFLGLMAKLRKGRIGLLRTSTDAGQRTEAFVVVTNEGDRRFYAHVLDEESDRLAEEIVGMPPMEKLLEQRGIGIPDRFVRDFTYDELVAVVDGRMAQPEMILRLPAAAEQAILVSPLAIEGFPSRARDAVRKLLNEPPLLSAVAKSCDSSVAKLKAVLDSDHATAWAGLTKCLFDARKDLETNRSTNVPKALYAGAAVVHRLSTARASSERERIKQEKERLQNLEVLAAEVRSDPRKVIPQVDLDKLLDEYRARYGNDFESFREEFYARYTTPKERRNLATIQALGTSYVHRDNIYRVFLDRFQDAQAELYSYYLGVMAGFVRSRQSADGEAFSSYQSFCNDIRARLPKVDRVLGELFQKPFLLAEVIIYGEKKRRNVSSIDEVRTILARFFVSDDMELRDFATIFELSLMELFETAFVQLPVLLQIWFKITGRYDSSRETITRRSGAGLGRYRDAGSPASDVDRVRREPTADEDSSSRGRGSAGTATVARRARKTRDAQRIKYYTRRDQEKAWEQFGQALKQ